MTETLAVITTVWGVVMALSPLLQMRVIMREQDASGTSLGWVVILLVGFALWLVYGLVNGVVPIIVTNVVAISVSLALLVTVRRYAVGRSATS